jgi:hypothetical protein
MNKVWIRDVAERTAATYVQAFIGLLLAGWTTDTVDLSLVQAAAVAAVPAALAVVKGALASRVPGTISPASLTEV